MIGALAGGAFVDKGGALVVQLALAASAPTNHNSHEEDDPTLQACRFLE